MAVGVFNAVDSNDRRGATLLPDPEPEALWCPIISTDDHVLEPFDLFSDRVPAKFRDLAPRGVPNDDGILVWAFDDHRAHFTVGDGAAGRPKREWNAAPQRPEEFRPGVADPKARLADMDLVGVWAQLGFPSMPFGFAGSSFAQMRDPEVGLASLRAYNDWMIDQWCAADRRRFIPCQLAWLRDPSVAAADIYKNADRGFRAVSFSENPEHLGFGSIHGPHWEPFFAACEDTGTVVNLHCGSSGNIMRPSADSPHEVMSALFPVSGIVAVIDWIFARVPSRFPNLRIVLSESGFTWVPMAAERLIRSYRGQDVTDVWRADDAEPVHYLRENFWFASVEDPAGFQMIDMIGDDRVMVETDYPHFDTTWPLAQDMVRGQMDRLDGMTPDRIQRICYGNAAALYSHPEPPADWIDRSVVGRRAAARA